MDDFFHGHLGIQRLDPRSSPRCLGQLTSDPERRSLVDFGVRYWPVSRFPFVVLYDLYAHEVLVLGVMHTAQESGKWLAERL